MSAKLALRQLSSLQQSKEQPKDIVKTIKKKRRQHKKQQVKAQQQREKQTTTYQQNLEYYKATQTASQASVELMSKVFTFECFYAAHARIYTPA
jgi:hypothetical protein